MACIRLRKRDDSIQFFKTLNIERFRPCHTRALGVKYLSFRKHDSILFLAAYLACPAPLAFQRERGDKRVKEPRGRISFGPHQLVGDLHKYHAHTSPGRVLPSYRSSSSAMDSALLSAKMPPAPLSRTSSAHSFSSEDDASLGSSPATVISSSRRTRKRFTNIQLTMLENLFHQNSHPSREDREAVAKAGGMEIKSVTIWFQNKRQTERKTAAVNNSSVPTDGYGAAMPHITSTIHTFSLHNDNHSSRTASPPFSVPSRASSAASSYPTTASRPSLDRVASRSELRTAAPRTPSRRHNLSGAIWDSMPSSPLAPPISPPAREFIDFGKNAKTRRTLEWACAAARLADKDGYATGLGSGSASLGSASASAGSASHHHRDREHRERGRERDHPHHHHHRHTGSGGSSRRDRGHTSSSRRESSARRLVRSEGSSASLTSMDFDAQTDEEDHEAITPPSTWGKGDPRWTTGERGGMNIMSLTSAAAAAGVEDDDMLKAALALCGLGRRGQC
ncbi:unnamed protein product [Cyclocybe aegerita]|uniref:Homeobox domain-containing protein n=1 Tax=Cyclocybe aegerita TaxID=1973307 RepID=A0A8S0XSK6_CYCAE|nr:unnamed protein product [Cyclocybe aegerita]